MESLEMQKRIINLGKALVEELGLDPGVDTLARWMAHYIAEQMEIAKNTTGDDKIEAEQRCFETILKLWQHRSFLPNGWRPFENFEPIFQALERLDPENKQPYYFNNTNKNSLEPDKTSKATESVQRWLDVASGIDQVVRIWLDYVFKQAALCATDEKTIEWLKSSVCLQDIDDTSIIIRLLPEAILSNDEITTERMQHKKRELIISRIKKLEAFNDFNQVLLSIFEQELEEISVNDSSLNDSSLNENDMK